VAEQMNKSRNIKQSNAGIKNLKEAGLLEDEEYTELLEKNAQRLIDRINDFSSFFIVLEF